MRTTLKLASIAVFACAATIGSEAAHAQEAWVGYKNDLNLNLTYSYATSNDVIASGQYVGGSGKGEFKNEPIVNHSAVVDVEYDPLDKWSVDAQLAMVADQWSGGDKTAHGPWDNGSLHFTAQDAQIGTHYMVLTAPFALTPNVSVSFPTHNYVSTGYAGAGRHIDMLHIGLSAGKVFYSGVPGLFLEGQYEFSIGTHVKVNECKTYTCNNPMPPIDPAAKAINQNRSDVHLVAGYYITPKFEVNLGSDMRWTYGGVDFVKFTSYDTTVQHYHDRLLDEAYILAGGGLSYQLSNDLQLSAFVRLFIHGRNTRDSNVFGLGVNYQVM